MSSSRELHFPQFASLQRASQLFEQIREQLDFLRTVQPYANARFQSYLESTDLGSTEHRSVKAITLGSVLHSISNRYPNETVLEEIEYQARRLAKLQVDPAVIHEALAQFDQALLEEVRRQLPDRQFVARTIVNHYHLFVTNVINVTLYQLWRADSKLLEDMSGIELADLPGQDLKARMVYLIKRWAGADAVAIHSVSAESGQTQRRDAAEPEAGYARVESLSAHSQAPVAGDVPQGLLRPVGFLVRDNDCRVLAARWLGRYRSVWSFPILVGTRLLGVLQLAFAKSYDWLPSEEAVLLRVTERLGLAIIRGELVAGLSSREAQVRHLATHLQQVEERERKRISRELHDEAGQSLLCLRLQLEMIESALPKRQKSVREEIRRAREQVETIIVEIRRLISALSPSVLEQFGLFAGIRHLLKDFLRVSEAQVEMQIDLPEHVRISSAAGMVTYRFIQEALHNILSHSQASTVKISSQLTDGMLMWQVADDGVGFNLDEVQRRQDSYGLRGISERVLLLGGGVEIQSQPGGGTVVTARMPIATREPGMPGLAALASAMRPNEQLNAQELSLARTPAEPVDGAADPPLPGQSERNHTGVAMANPVPALTGADLSRTEARPDDTWVIPGT